MFYIELGDNIQVMLVVMSMYICYAWNPWMLRFDYIICGIWSNPSWLFGLPSTYLYEWVDGLQDWVVLFFLVLEASFGATSFHLCYYDTCDVAILEILFANEMLWYYSAASCEKLFMHVFGLIKDVASKFFIWLYHLCVLSL